MVGGDYTISGREDATVTIAAEATAEEIANSINSYNSDLDRYSYEVDDYQRSLQSYVNDAQYFAREALEYANCEIRNLN